MSPEHTGQGIDLGLTKEEKQELKDLARFSIASRAQGKAPPEPAAPAGVLAETRGAFVSIYKQGMLRGCIGSLHGEGSLVHTVQEMAQAAAFRDPRFTPVTPDELDYLEIELSVLTPFRQVQDPEHIVVGRDGLLVTRGSHSGLLLPQVASERDWDRLTFLQETCRKAGLSPDAWQDEQTTIYAFSADVF